MPLGRSLAAAALAGAAVLVVPAAAPGFALLDHRLGLDQRDVRVLANFADPEASDGGADDVAFPGATGAPLAIWKASVEWGSRLHGDGSGDPTQPFDLGSGGASFDASWQGLATSPGGATDNVHSASSSLGPGILAATELGSGGWRIRYNEDFVWDDGPGPPVAGAVDLQTVATHEYGHAIGLAHTTALGCVMAPAASAPVVRDLCPDDAAAVQAAYGVAPATKPRLDAALVTGEGTLLLLGASFAPAGNEVWLTQAAAGGDGTPVTVTGLAATAGGTRIELALPAAAGDGDVLVRVPGTGGAALSNAWPLAVAGDPPSCGAVEYGAEETAAGLAVAGGGATVAAGGTATLEVSGFDGDGAVLVALATEQGVATVGGAPVLVDLGTVVAVTPVPVFAGAGAVELAVPTGAAGTTVYAQAGGVDGEGGVVTSNGLAVVVCGG